MERITDQQLDTANLIVSSIGIGVGLSCLVNSITSPSLTLGIVASVLLVGGITSLISTLISQSRQKKTRTTTA